MKKLYSLLIFSILMILTSCRLEIKNNENIDIVKYEKSELFGRWIRTSKIENLKNSEESIVSKFVLKDDSTAEIEILAPNGHKSVTGKWEINKKQKMGAFSFKSDIALTFDWDDNHRQIMSLSVEELNKKKILTAQKIRFEKD